MNRNKWMIRVLMLVFAVCACLVCADVSAQAAKKKSDKVATEKKSDKATTKKKSDKAKTKKKKRSYKVTTKTKPCIEKYEKSENEKYNKYTKQYYMLRSYLEKMQKKGGTLTLKKGTYKLPCTLYVPSNVTIKCKSGVKLVKTGETGTKKLKPGKFMFQMISAKKAKTKRKIAAYKASKNVVLSGSGKVTVDLGNEANAMGIYLGHANNVTVKNIRFKNRNGGNYIWVEGSKKVTISKCKFYKGTAQTELGKQMAVRLETINSVTNGFGGKWSKLDNTVNSQITISGNYFYSPQVGVGSVKHVSPVKKGKATHYYQKGIKITKNVFSSPGRYAICATAWKTPEIAGNTMKRQTAEGKIDYYIIGLGVLNPSISGNTFNRCHYAVVFSTAVNYGKGSNFAKLDSVIDDAYGEKLRGNTIYNMTHYYVFNGPKRILYYRNRTDKNFTLTPNSVPYREEYTERSDFSAKRTYYVFQSYMNQLEYAGGGTVTVAAGTYNVTNNICIPSNVTLNLRDGVVFKKAGKTATDVSYAKSIFTIVPPSKESAEKSVSGYNGCRNVKIKGSGTVKIDCTNVLNAMAVVMGHAQNVSISGITFLNQYGSHFIELNSSKDVTVENCTFKGFKPNKQKSYKECINVDGTDEHTNGFLYDWSSHDKTACRNVYIRNNVFNEVGTAVGSHTYSANNGTQIYHENVQIYENKVEDTYNAAIRVLNWRNCIIKDNIFKNIQSMKDGELDDYGRQIKYVALFFRGVVNPTVTGNTFDTMEYYPIRIIQLVTPKPDEAKASGYPNTVSKISDENWAAMKKNTLINIPDWYKYILNRADEDGYDKDAAKESFEA